MFFEEAQQQPALVKLLSLQCLPLPVTVNEKITQTLFPSLAEKQEQMKKGALCPCLQDTER